ncbi:hypothetical protein BX661DRAFT_180511 [Kickxella alabastrina]|uniref:uncharacterized protein n=1 Tax=Kickxella alabastrina TaxID=61397 RepID=UPI00221E9223|nr:uncharacterized protein BX661DRAFT_180511 [Kickxella alabastrina]KAI7831025.1 hypothetical protein BX661DRAFT_180511 [Kickxella alabastrina]
MSSDDRIAKAASFLLHSPPGEVDDVFNDIRGIVNDDDALQAQIEPQFLVVEVPGQQSTVLLTPYNQVSESRYLDPNTGTVFTFDHLRPAGALQTHLDQYVANHYTNGSVSVFAHEGAVVSCIVSNKFSPGNFWNGSWRAVWSFNPAMAQLNGSAKVRVHYFEDGNVQLDTQSDFAGDIEAGRDVAKKVAKMIGQFEADFQQGINDGYRQLAERTFKGLRRTLPVTRNKIDWEKIANYKIGGELAHAEN